MFERARTLEVSKTSGFAGILTLLLPYLCLGKRVLASVASSESRTRTNRNLDFDFFSFVTNYTTMKWRSKSLPTTPWTQKSEHMFIVLSRP